MAQTRKRGGKRPGAGRPPNFTVLERVAIWGRCAVISQRIAREDAKRVAEERFAGDEIEEGIKAIEALSLNDREKALALLESGNEPPADSPDRIIDAFSEMASRREALDKKGRGVRGTSYGQREAILSEAAAWASERFGRKVSAGQVAEILKDRDGAIARIYGRERIRRKAENRVRPRRV
jgi:hypothetical protein